MPDDKPVDRRRFFRAALGELFGPLSRAVAPIERAARQIGALEAGIAPVPASTPRPARRPLPQFWLRPPGALGEEEFASTCSRCGDCVRVCPARCIRIEPGSRGDGLPFIDVDQMPCVLCDGLLCMHACPSGALVPTPLADIDMGTARWQEETCLRSIGEQCTLCIDHCPVGSVAIELRDDKVHVIEEGCVGCGVCEHDCPTTPKSITVEPKAIRIS